MASRPKIFWQHTFVRNQSCLLVDSLKLTIWWRIILYVMVILQNFFKIRPYSIAIKMYPANYDCRYYENIIL